MSRPVLAACVACCIPLVGCSGTSNAQGRGAAEAPRRVQTTRIRQDQVRRAIDIVATLAASEEVTISSEVQGKVSRIRADMGDRVAAGDVLVELDREKLEYRYAASRAALERARARYGLQGDGPAGLRPLESTPEVQKAAAELSQAQQAVGRARELSRRGLLPNQQLDEAESRFQSAKAAYDAALQNARNLRADIDATEANARLAERELRDAQVRAPFGGYVQKRLVAPGMFVQIQTPLFAVVKIDPLKATGEVPERLAPWVRIGQGVELRVEAYPDAVIGGTITRISPAVNPQTRAFALEVTVPNGDGRLKPGTFARARIVTDRVDTVLSVPVTALQYRYGVNRVFVVRGDRVAAKEVKTGDRLGDRMEVTSGLSPGDQIVTRDVDSLGDGVRVTR